MAHLPTLVTDLALILIVAGAMTLLCKKLRQPVIIGYIVAGFLIGPFINVFPSIGDAQNISTLAEIGVIFMMFALGLDFNLQKMFSVGTTAIVSAAVQIFGMTVLGYFTGLLLGWSSIDSLFLGGMLGMSSTIITIKAIDDGGFRKQKFANLAIGTLIIEDIFAIFLMLILVTISVSRSDGGQLFLQIGLMLVYLFLWLLLGIFFVPTLMKRLKPLMNNETLLIVSLAICFGMVVLADALGFSAALGAFMAGSILASTAISERIERLVIPLKDLFVAVFFVSVGLIVVPATIVANIIPVLVITAVAIIGKVFLLTVSQVATGQNLNTALHGAFAQTQVGEFSFIIAALGVSLGVTADFLYPVIVAVAVITTFSTPFLLRIAAPSELFLRKILSQKLLDEIERRSTQQDDTVIEASPANWQKFLKRFFSSFIILGALIGGIIFAGVKLLLPAAQEMFGTQVGGVLACLAIYVVIGPFFPPLIVCRRTQFTALWLQNRNNRFPLAFLLGLRVAVAALAIIMPPLIIFRLPIFVAVLVAVPFSFGAARSRWLLSQYLHIAAKFLVNLNEKRLVTEGDRGENWIDKQIKVGCFHCVTDSIACGKTLAEMNWGRKLHINVIKIQRGKKHINIPSGQQILNQGDRVYVSGSFEAISNFILYIRQQNQLEVGECQLISLHDFIESQDESQPERNVLVTALRLENNSVLVNKSIKEANIRNIWSCFVIGIERERYPFIDPNPNMVFRINDTLWILGTQKMATTLIQQGLL